MYKILFILILFFFFKTFITETEDISGKPTKIEYKYKLDSTEVTFEETFKFDDLQRLQNFKRKDNTKLIYEYFGDDENTLANNRNQLRFIRNEAEHLLRQYDDYNEFGKAEIIREFYNPPNEFDFVEIHRVYLATPGPGYSNIATETTQVFGSKASPAFTVSYDFNSNGTLYRVYYPQETASLIYNYKHGSILDKVTKDTPTGGSKVLLNRVIDPDHLTVNSYTLYQLPNPVEIKFSLQRDNIISAFKYGPDFFSTFDYDKRNLRTYTGQWVANEYDHNRSYVYDNFKRLTHATATNPGALGVIPADKFASEIFTFDKFDNILTSKINGVDQTYNKRGFRNQYHSYYSEGSTKRFKYDNRGNLTEDENFLYSWDDFDRLTSARKRVNGLVTSPLPEAQTFSETTAGSNKIFVQNWVYGTGIHSVKLEGLNKALVKNQIQLELLNASLNYVPVEFILQAGTGFDQELLINLSNLDFSSSAARLTIADELVTITNIDARILHPEYELRGGNITLQEPQSVTADFISLNSLDEILIDIPFAKFNSNATVEVDVGTGFQSVPFAAGVKSSDPAGNTSLILFSQAGVQKIKVSIDSAMDTVTVFTVRTFGDAEVGQRVDYMYDGSNRRIARHFYGISTLGLERAVYDGLKLIEERQYTSGQLQRRYYHSEATNGLIAIEEDADNNGTVDSNTDNVYIPLLDDRGTLMGVLDKTGQVIEKLYYNSSGLVKSYIFNGATFIEAVDTEGNNIGRSLFIRSGWTGMYHEPFTEKYHTLFREYDPQHLRWLSEDPAGMANGMNLYFAYMNVNEVDLMGDNIFEFIGYLGSPKRLYYNAIGFKDGLMDQGQAVVDLLTMAGDSISFAYTSSWDQKCDKFNKAREFVFEIVNNNPAILKAIIEHVADFSNKFSRSVYQNQDPKWVWKLEGRVASEILVTFLTAGGTQIAKLGKGPQLTKFLNTVTKGLWAKHMHCGSNSKFVKAVGHFLKLECFVAGTQVPTINGLVNIEDIKIDDKVLSLDQKTGIKGYYGVVSLTQSHPTELYHITYKDAKGEAYILITTGEHPFWVSDKGWIAARELSIADKLPISADSFVTVSSFRYEKAEKGKTFTTYNFEVADTHTYFVLPEGKTDGSFAVWVHNTCGGKDWLKFHEGSNLGHTKLKHIGKSDDELFNRMTKSFLDKKYGSSNYIIKGSSTFTDLETAQKSISQVFGKNRNKINQWLRSSSSSPLNINLGDLGFTTGRGIKKSDFLNGNYAIKNLKGASVVLKKNGRGGHFIFTSFAD